jgi:hypothetical protein
MLLRWPEAGTPKNEMPRHLGSRLGLGLGLQKLRRKGVDDK